MSVENYKYWSKYYYEHHGWYTIPVTCKCPLFSGVLNIKNNTINFPEENIFGDLTLENWHEKTFEIAKKHSENLTGIGCVLKPSKIVLLDFDDETFYSHWCDLYPQIKSKRIKSGKGYHVYLETIQPFEKSFLTRYYDVFGQGCMILPPSNHYERHEARSFKPTNKFYTWIKEKVPMVEVDIYNIGLVPKWVGEDKRNTIKLDGRSTHALNILI